MKKIIDAPTIGDGRFKRWTKTVSKVDTSKTNGFCFEGDFIRSKQELEIGTYILAYGEEGSRNRHSACVELYEVTEDGLKKIYDKRGLSPHWALDVRDDIARIVNK